MRFVDLWMRAPRTMAFCIFPGRSHAAQSPRGDRLREDPALSDLIIHAPPSVATVCLQIPFSSWCQNFSETLQKPFKRPLSAGRCDSMM